MSTNQPPRRARRAAATGSAVALVFVSACATSGTSAVTTSSGARIVHVVAAENSWGSLAAQLGGTHATVRNIIDNPSADPHDYEPTTADAIAMARAQLTVVNGVGYDTWASKLIAANPVPGRVLLNVGDVVGAAADGNPHRWYSPTDVRTMLDAFTAGYIKVDPADTAYFNRQHQTVLARNLKPYFDLVAAIKSRYAGTPIGASESVVTPLAAALGLRLLTPAPFLRAISEGADPSAQDKSLIDRQISRREIKVYVYNSQNATPDVQAQVNAARNAGIAVTTLTETLTPAGASFQDWQVRELRALQHALAETTGR